MVVSAAYVALQVKNVIERREQWLKKVNLPLNTVMNDEQKTVYHPSFITLSAVLAATSVGAFVILGAIVPDEPLEVTVQLQRAEFLVGKLINKIPVCHCRAHEKCHGDVLREAVRRRLLDTRAPSCYEQLLRAQARPARLGHQAEERQPVSAHAHGRSATERLNWAPLLRGAPWPPSRRQ